MNREFLLSAIVFVCMLTIIVLNGFRISELRKENDQLKSEQEIEIGFVIDARDRTWIRIKHGRYTKAVSCDGDSVFFMINNWDVDF